MRSYAQVGGKRKGCDQQVVAKLYCGALVAEVGKRQCDVTPFGATFTTRNICECFAW